MMNQPEKPFCCREIGCGESFTNADRLAVHSKKHDLVLQLGNKGGSFVGEFFFFILYPNKVLFILKS